MAQMNKELSWAVRKLETIVPLPPLLPPSPPPKTLHFGPSGQLQKCEPGSGNDNALSARQLLVLHTDRDLSRLYRDYLYLGRRGHAPPIASCPWIHCQFYLVLENMKLPGP